MKILKKHSTKPERVIADMLIKKKVSFKFRELINGREIDFLIGRVIVEVDGIHHQPSKDRKKDIFLSNLGYIPLHFSAKEIRINPQETFKKIMKLVEANN